MTRRALVSTVLGDVRSPLRTPHDATLADPHEPDEVPGDSAYGTGEALDELDKAGRVPPVKLWPRDTPRTPARDSTACSSRRGSRQVALIRSVETSYDGLTCA